MCTLLLMLAIALPIATASASRIAFVYTGGVID